MSLQSALTIAASGISVSSKQLEITSSNISNASTEGYTKKTAVTSAAALGEIGGGAEVSGYIRAENTALYDTMTEATAAASMLSKQDEYLQQVQDLLGTSSSDNPQLSQYITDFINTWNELSATPESLVIKQQVVSDATNIVDEVSRLSTGVETLDRRCYTEINSTVSDLNSYLDQIQSINAQIAMSSNSGLSTGNLEDKRDQLVVKVSNIIDVTTFNRGNGQIGLYTKSGYQLVDGSSVATLSYDGTDVTSTTNTTLSLNDALSGGSLEALVKFRAETSPASTDSATSVIQKLRSQLDAVVDAFISTTTTATTGEDTFAAAYASASATGTELDTDFFTGTDRTDFEVNASLVDGSATVKSGVATVVSDALLDDSRVFSADGLNVTGASYTSLTTAMFASFQQAASNISTLSANAETTRSYLEEKFTNETAVNVDAELVNLVTYQNAYAASAHVMDVIDTLFEKLESLV